jgi:hypothetical protein
MSEQDDTKKDSRSPAKMLSSKSLTPVDPDFGGQMSLAEDIMHEDRDLLRALATRRID